MRRQIIEMAKRRAKPGTGSHVQALREQKGEYGSVPVVPEFDGIDFAVIGGLATARYMPARMTLDTDVLVHADDLQQAEEQLKQSGCTKIGALTVGGSTWEMPGGRCLDLIALDGEWVDEALAQAEREDDELPYISLPYLVLMKLVASRVQDLADISRMLGLADADVVDDVRTVVGKYSADDVDDLERLIELGKLEMEETNG